MNEHEEQLWEDVRNRSLLVTSLILDTESGLLEMMVAGNESAQSYPVPDMGEEILSAARDLQNASKLNYSREIG